MVYFPDNYQHYCDDSHLRYYDFSPFLLLETLEFRSFCGLRPLDPLQGSSLGTLQCSPYLQMARPMTFACRALSTTLSLTQQTFHCGGVGDHMKFSQRERVNYFSAASKGRIKNATESFIPFLPHPSHQLKNDNFLTVRS